MTVTRRQGLKLLASALLPASASSLVAGCASLAPGPDRSRAALLLPLSGRPANIGQNMAEAASLALLPEAPPLVLDVIDSGLSAETAAEAAKRAAGDGAAVILGPLFGTQVPAVVAAVGATPVVTFSNDGALVGSGAFVFGITPAQSVSAILRYARQQGVRQVAVVHDPDELGRQAAEAAMRSAPEAGLALTAAIALETATDIVERLRQESGGSLPDAVLLPGGGDRLAVYAAALAPTGLQLLGTAQWSSARLSGIPALRGAWFAAPDPAASARFARLLEAGQGGAAGVLAGLAYDATAMSQTLAASARLDRAGLTRSAGFPGVVGSFRLLPDGGCIRELAILTVGGGGGVSAVDRVLSS